MHPIQLNAFPSRTVEIDGDPWLYFGGTAYLGLQANANYQEILIRNIRRFGASYGASRLSNVRFPLFDEAESVLSQWTGYESALTLSSGYLACQLLCQTLEGSGHPLFALPNSHVALRTLNTRSDFNGIHHLATTLESSIRSGSTPVLLVDSIDFHGELYPDFKMLDELPMEDLILVVDDSHGLGVVGPGGRGSLQALKHLHPRELIACASLNKGLALQAGVILGQEHRTSQLRQTPFFAGASPCSPATLGTFLEALDLYETQAAVLQQRLASFSAKVDLNRYFEYNPGHAAFSIRHARDIETLSRHRILATQFDYPAQKRANLSRIVISAAHGEEDIEALAHSLEDPSD
ncbi:hypothetical protein [Pelagicoccus sp. SDUM812003]|uniref:hypothetical protein n=1 Tax=Pelagicoccus sp. SDUM812003 TaxID=3041267 RepID=UPI0028108D28|nr:hypothetical protein [Pelagicoccus sp. SDUM812003]MDQ8201804.1 hypothetical protein [Pelagicoccus sp. SDUM812003]